MNKVKKLTVALLVLVIGMFAGFALVACGGEEPAPRINVTVADVSGTFIYTGSAQTPDLEVKNNGKALTKDVDYTLTYENNVNVGTATVTVTFMGKYEKQLAVQKNFTIGAYDASGATVTVEDITYGSEPSATVTLDGFTLVENTDYKVVYGNYTMACEGITATVTFKGNFTGSATTTYNVNRKAIEKPAQDTTEFIYDGTEKTYNIVSGTGYVVVGNVTATDVGTEYITVTLKPNYVWADGTDADLTYEFTISGIDGSDATFTVADVTEGETPTALVELEGYELVEGTDYEVNYGAYDAVSASVTATLTFKGNYSGTLTTTYAVKSIAEKIGAYLDFNGEIADRIGEKTTSMSLGTASYVDGVDGKAIKLNPTTSVVKIDGLSMGTESFTISFDLNIDQKAGEIADNNFQILSSLNMNEAQAGAYFDHHPSSFEWGFRGKYNTTIDGVKKDVNTFRIQAGRNDGNASRYVYDQITLGAWQNWTIVVERKVGYDEKHTSSSTAYNADGTIFDTTVDGVATPNPGAKEEYTYSTPEKATIKVYLNGEMVQTREMWYSDGQSIGFGSIYLGGQRAKKNYNFTMDNFVFLNDALSDVQVKNNLPAYVASVSANTKYFVADTTFSFVDVSEQANADGGYVGKIAVNAGAGKTVSGAKLVNAPAGVALTDNGDGTYALGIAANLFASAKDGLALTVEIDDELYGKKTASFKVYYTALENIYVNVEKINVWSDEVADGKYTFDVVVGADAELTLPITMGVTFGGIDGITYEYNNGAWKVSIPSDKIVSGEAVEVSVNCSLAEVEAKVISVQLDLNADEYATILNAIDVYMPLNGDIVDYASGRATAMDKGETAVFDNDALKVTTGTSTVAVNDSALGLADFTMSFDLRLDSFATAPSNSSYEIVTSMESGDSNYNTFQLSYHGGNGFRWQAGRNDSGFYYTKSKEYFTNATDVHKVTLVMDRAVEIDNTYKSMAQNYASTGLYYKDINPGAKDPVHAYLTNEKVYTSIYIDGVLIETKTDWLNNFEVLGVGTIYLGGGEYADKNTAQTSTIDNFTLYNVALNAKQVRALNVVQDDILDDVAVAVEDVAFTYEDTDVIDAGEVALIVDKGVASANGKIVEIKNLPAGVTLVGEEGSQKLAFTADGLTALKGSKAYTAVFESGVEREFTVAYTALDAIYTTEVKFYAYESGNVERTFTVTADVLNTVPYGGEVNFGALSEYVTAGEGTGNYVLKGDLATIKSANAEMTTLDGAVKGNINFTFLDYLVDDAEVLYAQMNASKPSINKDHRMYENVTLGAESFTVSLMWDDYYQGETSDVDGGQAALFGTGTVDLKNGFLVYPAFGVTSGIRMRQSLDTLSGNVNTGRLTTNLNQFKNWHNLTAHFIMTKTETGYSLTIKYYHDYEEFGTFGPQALAKDYNANWVNDDGSVNTDFFVGCAKNLDTKNPANGKVIGTANVIVCNGIMPIDLIEAKNNATCGETYSDRIAELNATSAGKYTA